MAHTAVLPPSLLCSLCTLYYNILNLYYILYCCSPAGPARSVWPRKLTSGWPVLTPPVGQSVRDVLSELRWVWRGAGGLQVTTKSVLHSVLLIQVGRSDIREVVQLIKIFTETQTGVTIYTPARLSALRMSRDEQESPPGVCPSPPASPQFPPEVCPSPRQV